jgi:hypothetical protein
MRSTLRFTIFFPTPSLSPPRQSEGGLAVAGPVQTVPVQLRRGAVPRSVCACRCQPAGRPRVPLQPPPPPPRSWHLAALQAEAMLPPPWGPRLPGRPGAPLLLRTPGATGLWVREDTAGRGLLGLGLWLTDLLLLLLLCSHGRCRGLRPCVFHCHIAQGSPRSLRSPLPTSSSREGESGARSSACPSGASRALSAVPKSPLPAPSPPCSYPFTAESASKFPLDQILRLMHVRQVPYHWAVPQPFKLFLICR